MSSSSARADRAYHQDYIARIRYSNSLPPPPILPKLLNIPNTGLSSGQYTSAAFTSRLAREQPLNIEADAELGMPINLIGLPGVFEGDDSSIKGFENPSAPHPHDRPLLRPLTTLGKPAAITTGVSFLRRTEYISSDQGRSRFESTTSKDLVRPRPDSRKRKRSEFENGDDPSKALRSIMKSFELAYPKDLNNGIESTDNHRAIDVTSGDRVAWESPRHPSKQDVKLLDSYPILPDISAFPDSGSYLVIKFITNPLAVSDTYDQRLDVGLLRPLEISPEEQALIEAQRIAHDADPAQPRPTPVRFNYEFFLPPGQDAVDSIKTKFNANALNREDPKLYDDQSDSGKQCFRYGRLRVYETYQQVGEADDLFGDTLALALHDGREELQDNDRTSINSHKAAYFYPIAQRTFIRPRRDDYVGTGVMSHHAISRPEETKVDFLDVVVREPDETEISRRKGHRLVYDTFIRTY